MSRVTHAILIFCLFAVGPLGAQPPDLTGVWSCSDGGTYYIRQVGNEVWWYGRSGDQGATWTNVFHGAIQQNRIAGKWADVPQGVIRGAGTMDLQIVSLYRLTSGSVTGGFGGKTWTRGGEPAQPAAGGTVTANNSLLGTWQCPGRLYTFSQEGGEVVGRWTVVDATSVNTGRPVNEAGYRMQQVSPNRYTGQTLVRDTGGRSNWKPTTITVNGNTLANSGGDACSKTLTRVSGPGAVSGAGGSTPGPSGGANGAAPRVNIGGNWIDPANLPFTLAQNGNNLAVYGPAGWQPGTGSFTGPNTVTLNFPGRGTVNGTVENGQINWSNGVVWKPGGLGGVIPPGTAPASGAIAPAAANGASPRVNLSGNWTDPANLPFTLAQNGNNLAVYGPAGWQPGTGSFTGPNTVTLNFPGRGTVNGTVENGQINWSNGVVWKPGGPGGVIPPGTAPASGAVAPAAANGASPRVNLSGNWTDPYGGTFTLAQIGNNLNFYGSPGYQPGTGSFTGPNTFTMNFPGRGTLNGTVENGQITWSNGVVWKPGGPGGVIPPGAGSASGAGVAGGSGGPCADPRTLQIMDQWLLNAIPPQPSGSAMRYEPWGRLVNRSRSAELAVTGAPDTRLSRCEWLWERSQTLTSSNGLGTLWQYVTARR
jgi:hypothetical protein